MKFSLSLSLPAIYALLGCRLLCRALGLKMDFFRCRFRVLNRLFPSKRQSSRMSCNSDSSGSKEASEPKSSPRKPLTRSDMVNENKKKFLQMSLEDKRKLYACGNGYTVLVDIPLWSAYAKTKHLKNVSDPSEQKREPNPSLNNKVSIFVGDITKLEIDAIVNAANNSLMGGGGVDGAIHRAAGMNLKSECSTLNGCDTGDAKITLGYDLPAKYVIHTVGPVGEQPTMLKSCYLKSLELVTKYKLTSVAIPCISTGIYGYSNKKACPVVLDTVREWLETGNNAESIERIIFCLFLPEDIKIYETQMLKYFPLK